LIEIEVAFFFCSFFRPAAAPFFSVFQRFFLNLARCVSPLQTLMILRLLRFRGAPSQPHPMPANIDDSDQFSHFLNWFLHL
jgi:hypothetical protein